VVVCCGSLLGIVRVCCRLSQLARFTAKAELLASSQTAKEALHVNRLLEELLISLDDHHIRIECDNDPTSSKHP
jgi:hypothetical protein